MANEINWPGILTGVTEYFSIRQPGTYQYWNTNSAAFENFTVANWNLGYYAIALTETPSGGYHFQGTWPAGVSTAGYYYVEIYKRVGASVNIADKACKMGEMLGYWNGTIFRAYKSDIASVADTAQTARDLGANADTAGTTKLLAALTPVQSTVNDAAATTTVFITALSFAVTDFFKGQAVVFTSGALAGQLGQIATYNGSTKAITLQSALTSAPANGVAFSIVNVAASRKLADIIAAASAAGKVAATVAAGDGADAATVKAYLDTTAIAELTGDPGATPGGIIKALCLLYMKARNAETTTATAKTVKNSAGTTILTHTLADDGTTFTKGKLA